MREWRTADRDISWRERVGMSTDNKPLTEQLPPVSQSPVGGEALFADRWKATVVDCLDEDDLKVIFQTRLNEQLWVQVQLAQAGGKVLDAVYTWAVKTGQDLPRPDELGHALLRLARPVGFEHGPRGTRRGWVRVPVTPPDIRPEAPLVVPHYAGDQPLKLALDTKSVLGLNENGTRVRYVLNTSYISVGAPCFDISWNLLAVHQSCPGGFESTSSQCQGTPVAAIRNWLDRLGRLDVLGADPD